VIELKRRPAREETVLCLMRLLQGLALVPDSVVATAASGIIPPCIGLIQDHGLSAIGRSALLVISNLALRDATHKALMDAKAVELTGVPFIKYLASKNPDELSMGLQAAALVCRL